MREKLIELLSEDVVEFCNVDIIAGHCKIRAITFDVAKFADHLIANGVTIPVRCKECKHWCYEYDDVGLCVTDVPDIDGVQRLADDFCSYGARKGEGNG